MRKLKSILSNISFALMLGVLTLVVLDNHNPMLKFLTSTASKIFIVTACAFAAVTLILVIAETEIRKYKDDNNK